MTHEFTSYWNVMVPSVQCNAVQYPKKHSPVMKYFEECQLFLCSHCAVFSLHVISSKFHGTSWIFSLVFNSCSKPRWSNNLCLHRSSWTILSSWLWWHRCCYGYGGWSSSWYHDVGTSTVVVKAGFSLHPLSCLLHLNCYYCYLFHAWITGMTFLMMNLW